MVTEREYKVIVAHQTFKPGMTTFVVQNRGKLGHEFEIRGPGVAGKRIAGTLMPGVTKTLTVRLRAGIYTLWCPIHVALGMKTSIMIAGKTSSTLGTGGTTTSSGTTTSGGGSWG